MRGELKSKYKALSHRAALEPRGLHLKRCCHINCRQRSCTNSLLMLNLHFHVVSTETISMRSVLKWPCWILLRWWQRCVELQPCSRCASSSPLWCPETPGCGWSQRYQSLLVQEQIKHCLIISRRTAVYGVQHGESRESNDSMRTARSDGLWLTAAQQSVSHR